MLDSCSSLVESQASAKPLPGLDICRAQRAERARVGGLPHRLRARAAGLLEGRLLVHLSPVHPGLCQSPSEVLEKLLGRAVRVPPA